MTTWEPHITIRALQPVVAALQVLGYDTPDLLDKVKITAEVLEQPESRIPHRQMMAFWQQAIDFTQDEYLDEDRPQDSEWQSSNPHRRKQFSLLVLWCAIQITI